MKILNNKGAMALALALIAGILAWLYLDNREDELLRRGRMAKVIAAKRYLSSYTRIRASDLEWREIPEEYVVKGYIRSDKDAIDQLSLVPFNEDEPLTYNKISSGNAWLSNSVPEGLRAFSLPVDRVSGIAGLLRPGDLVDVLYLDDPKKAGAKVVTLFQGVKVLAAGEYFSEHQEKADSNGSVTLALSPEESQLAMAAYNHGLLQLSLRGAGDARVVASTAVQASDAASRAAHKTTPQNAVAPPTDTDFIPKKR